MLEEITLNWQALGFLGLALCVLVMAYSVGTLTHQIRQNTQALEENAEKTYALFLQARRKSLITPHQLIQHSEFLPPILARLESSKTPEEAISTLDHEERIRLRSFALEVLFNLETQIHLYLRGAEEEDNALFQIKLQIRQRYPLWKALGTFEEANLSPNVRRFIEDNNREYRDH